MSDWDTVVNAFKVISDNNFELHLIGGCESKYNNVANVVQLPHLKFDAYKKEIEEASFVVLLLIGVPFSFGQMRLLQSMALGKCVLATKIPSLQDYIDDRHNALFFQ